jgi:glc operon protein GlcG
MFEYHGDYMNCAFLDQDQTRKVLEAICSALSERGQAAAIAVVDRHGELLAFVRTDGCPLSASAIAMNKAFTAAREGMPTRQFGRELRDGGFTLQDMGDCRYTTFPGGLPIRRGTEVVGGIGVSGIYDSHSDERLANLGRSAIGLSAWSLEYTKERGLENGLVQTIFQVCADCLVGAAQLREGERLLDVGCGSGVIGRTALRLQPGLCEVLGFDFVKEAVEVAIEERPDRRLIYQKGDACEATSYQPGDWDVVIAQHVVHQVPNCLPHMHRALKPGGRLLVCTWPEDLADCPAYDFLYTAAGERDEKAIDYGWGADRLSAALQAAGFQDIRMLDGTDRLHTPALRPREFLLQYLDGSKCWLGRSPEEKRAILANDQQLADLAARMPGTIEEVDGKFRFRIAMHAVMARKQA